ncbi:Uncharacterized protein SCF082_LOCUS5511 [Durusdinium trenchii]|uniref:Tyr recombinase domain-containing protein n=1 Tax=Durusdinium trenchii TaxID=1381693 RepID=A0ABP0I9A5_9DINO
MDLIEVDEVEDDEVLPELDPLHLEDLDFSFQEDIEHLNSFASGLAGNMSQDLARQQSPDSVLDADPLDEAHDDGVEVIDRTAQESFDFNTGTNACIVDKTDWALTVNHAFERHKALDPAMKLPWEQPSMQGIFHNSLGLNLPQVHGIALELPATKNEDRNQISVSGEVEACADAAFLSAVKDIQDLDYFENKRQQTDLACAKWLDILSINWSASAIGQQVCEDLRSDPTGEMANETLKACFGTKSYSTLLKRAGSLKRFILWHRDHYFERGFSVDAIPLHEPDVWSYFRHLRESRIRDARGYTGPATFLETVRFTKFTIALQGADNILESRRLQGFAAIEKREKGPTHQAPPMELEHLRRLHSLLLSADSIVDKVGAGCMLLCTYARARWSDLRFIHHVEIESKRNGCLVLYTTEHKTSAVGEKKEQYLPFVVPWDGVTNENWLQIFLDLYQQVGLNIHKVPLGPLLPAPRSGGGFCARPLTTSEAAAWLRGLLKGTSNWESFRSHSMKATLLDWCARSGMDKEVRSVLGHHCSAVSGSEVVYARHLQARPIRKLMMLLRLIRIGMGLEEIADRGNIAGVTPAVGTPGPGFGIHGCAARTPVLPVEHVQAEADPVQDAVEGVQDHEDQLSIKEEMNIATDIDSSSGSDSESSSTSSDEPLAETFEARAAYTEAVPEGLTFYKHVKSFRVHAVRNEQQVTVCKMKITGNFQELGRTLNFRYPKCLRCFPNDPGRVRSREDAVEALDKALERVRKARRSAG